jgi:sugar phosphate isomerase/epimerase
MQLGIFAKTFAGASPGIVLDAAAQAGYACVQYNMACSGLASMPDEIPIAAVDAIIASAGRSHMNISAVSGTYNMIHPDKNVRLQGQRRLEVLASRCHGIQTRLITLCTGSRDARDQWRHHSENASAEAWRELRDSMATALEIAERYDVDLGIEPELANVVSSAAKARQLIDELQSKRIKIVIDAANLFEREDLAAQRDVVSEATEMLADRIAMAHAKDRAPDGAFVAAGQGVLDYGHYLSCLKRAGFSGPLVTHGLSAAQAPGVAAFLSKHLKELD